LRNFMFYLLSWPLARALAPGLPLLSRIEERARREHDRFASGEPCGDRYARVVDGADLDVAPLDLVLAVDDIDVIALVVAEHGALRKHRRDGAAGGDPRLGKAARLHREGIGNRDADRAEPRLRVDNRG